MKIIDIGTITVAKRTALLSIRDYVDTRLGYPKPPTKTDGSPLDDPNDPAFGVTLHHTGLWVHPVTSTRVALLVPTAAAAHVATILAAMRAKVTAGTATAAETVVANLPDPVDPDSSWSTEV